MAWMDTCPGCKGWKSGRAMVCSECSGENSRRSYDNRTGMLAGNLRVAALEELRVRAATSRVCAALRRAAESVDGPARAALIEAAREVEG